MDDYIDCLRDELWEDQGRENRLIISWTEFGGRPARAWHPRLFWENCRNTFVIRMNIQTRANATAAFTSINRLVVRSLGAMVWSYRLQKDWNLDGVVVQENEMRRDET